MDPEPGTVAASLRASGQVGNLKLGIEIPHASLIDGENGEIVRFECLHVGLVRDSERTALYVVVSRSVKRGRGSAGTWGVASVAHITANEKQNSN